MKSLLTVLLFFIFIVCPQAALASSLYLSPGSGNTTQGGTLSVQVRLNTAGEGVNAVSAFLSYPADKLEAAWLSYGNSAFPIAAEGSFGGGIIKISRGAFNGVAGDVGVATIGFRAISPGLAQVSFIGGSQSPRVSDSSDSLTGSSGGAYNVGSIDATAQIIPQTAAASQISDIKIAEVASDSATITWQTDTLADSAVDYGLEAGLYIFNETGNVLVKDHTIKLTGSQMIPGMVYHFQVKSKNEAGNLSLGEDRIFQLLGYKIVVVVVDEQGNPVPGIEVILYSNPQKGITDGQGKVVFNNVSPGKHLAVARLDGVEKSQEIEVKGASYIQDTKNPNVQPTEASTRQAQIIKNAETFHLKIANSVIRKNTGFLAKIDPLWLIAMVIILAAFLGLSLRYLLKREKLPKLFLKIVGILTKVRKYG